MIFRVIIEDNRTIVKGADVSQWRFQPAAKQADGALTGTLTAADVLAV